ncbi:MAG: CDP-alcohol phosphatidyltransferase family protein [Minicystis sp.]
MASEKLVYKVDDRSILLPFYRRWLVDPLLPLIPARVNPNTITHAGHFTNLAGTVLLIALWPDRGWPLIAAMVMLQVYMWCDNADGSHARRTNQCSPFGEFLDHGLDQLNTVYIGYLTAMALGVPPIWWVIIALIIPGAGAVTYWEQSQTGVFRLGLLNQVESLTVLSIALTVSAIFGRDFWSTTKIFGISLQHAMLGWTTTTILFGMARALYRVGQVRGFKAVLPILGAIVFGGAIVLAAHLEAISTIFAVTLCTGLNVYFGMRMLAHRLHGEQPRVEALLVINTAILAVLVGLRVAGLAVSPLAGPAFAVVACGIFGLSAIGDTRRSIVHLDASSARG